MKISRSKILDSPDTARRREVWRRQKQRRRERGLCVWCLRRAEGKLSGCRGCLDAQAIRSRRLAANRWEDEECTKCGKPNDNLKYSACSKCRAKNAEYVRNKFGFKPRRKKR